MWKINENGVAYKVTDTVKEEVKNDNRFIMDQEVLSKADGKQGKIIEIIYPETDKDKYYYRVQTEDENIKFLSDSEIEEI